MNVLFLTLISFKSLQERNIYTDLLREFVKNGHSIFAVSPVEMRYREKTHLIEEEHAKILRLRIGNTQKTNIVEKGISTVLIEPIFKSAIARYFPDVKFDLILYSTPPITLVSPIKFVKKRDKALTYLMLKDIFPQNAVDMGMLSKTGINGLIYKHFRRKEQELYAVSDYIGCMSPANVDYVIKHNPDVAPEKVKVCPNSVEVFDNNIDSNEKRIIREKYGIPLNKIVFVYGGNLGKPQNVPFIIDCLEKSSSIEKAFFLIVGDGTEYGLLEKYAHNCNHNNFKLLQRLHKEDYDALVSACDVGLVFLDHRFTIPNFPSRLLSYMQAKLPVLAATDSNTDVGKIIVEGRFGWWCESNNSTVFMQMVKEITLCDCSEMKDNAYQYLIHHYSAKNAYSIIISEKRLHR